MKKATRAGRIMMESIYATSAHLMIFDDERVPIFDHAERLVETPFPPDAAVATNRGHLRDMLRRAAEHLTSGRYRGALSLSNSATETEHSVRVVIDGSDADLFQPDGYMIVTTR